jgi:thiol-disulfide isomerase/thioredoxin
MKTILAIALLLTTTVLFSQDHPQGLLVNDRAPDFTVKDQSGKSINLNNELKKKTVVLVFYRGEWCPYCNRELSAMWIFRAT